MAMLGGNGPGRGGVGVRIGIYGVRSDGVG